MSQETKFILQKLNGIYEDLAFFETLAEAKEALAAIPANGYHYRVFDVEGTQRKVEQELSRVNWEEVTCEDIARALTTTFERLPDDILTKLSFNFLMMSLEEGAE